MRSAKLDTDAAVSAASEDIFFMTNLSPRMTGLPMSVWVSPRGNARHDVRIKVNMSHGRQMVIENTAVVAIRPAPRVVTGELATDDREAVFEWIGLNREAVIAYWDDEIDTGEFIEAIKPLQATKN